MKGIVFVTGSSRGIGAATAKLAARRGYAVAINYVSEEERANEVAGDIRGKGGRTIVMQGDTASEKDVVRMFETIDRELGPLTALVNNAGITGRSGRLTDYSADDIRRILDVNVTGALVCAREAVKRMSTKNGGKGGSIVNLSSVAATLGGGGSWIPYGAAKGAINSFTLGLAREVAAEGIRVNAISPGVIDTEIHERAGLAGRLEQMRPTIPMQRIGTAEECAEAILWLISGEAAYMTGAILPVTGGR